jgi:hypothetical protein
MCTKVLAASDTSSLPMLVNLFNAIEAALSEQQRRLSQNESPQSKTMPNSAKASGVASSLAQ